MSTHDKQKLEDEINSDTELQKELELQNDIDKAILDESRVDQFMSNLNKIHDEQISSKQKVFNLHNKWYYAAASVTLLTGTAFYSLKQHFQSTDRLYSTYYQTWQPGVITRGAENETLNNKIIVDFEMGNYESVLNAFRTNYNNQTINPKMLLLKGCTEMELSKYKAAIQTFSLFESKNYTLYTESSQWYLALCYLKTEDINSLKNLLNKIVESNTSYAVEANQLLQKLN